MLRPPDWRYVSAMESALVDQLAIRYPEQRRAIRELAGEVLRLPGVHELTPPTVARVVEARLLATL